MRTRTLTIRLSPEQYEQLASEARQEDRPIGSLARRKLFPTPEIHPPSKISDFVIHEGGGKMPRHESRDEQLQREARERLIEKGQPYEP